MLLNYRDKNFNGIGPVLAKKAKIISSQFDEKHRDKSVQEIKQFVARLPHMLLTKQSITKRKFFQFYLRLLIILLIKLCQLH